MKRLATLARMYELGQLKKKNFPPLVRDAYTAGFKKAREMAAKLIEEGETDGSDLGIRKLGEDEL